MGNLEAGKRILFSSLGWGRPAIPGQCWLGLQSYKPCSGHLFCQPELDLGESKLPSASMGEILQADVFAGETPSAVHPLPEVPCCHSSPHSSCVCCHCSWLSWTSNGGWIPSTSSLTTFCLAEGCLSLCPISSWDPGFFTLFRAFLHKKP